MTAPTIEPTPPPAPDPGTPPGEGGRGPKGRRPSRLGGAWRWMGSVVQEYRPSKVTAGLPMAPLLVLAALNAVDELDRSAFATLLPEIRDYFGVSITTIITVSSIAGVLPILSAIPMGYLADRLNRTKMSGLGAAIWGVFSILTAFAGNLFFLGLFRLGSGMGKVVEPSSTSLLADHYPPNRRAGVYSVHRLGNSVGLLVAPLLAGLLASWFFWQLPFLIFGLPSLALSAFLIFRMKEPVRGGTERAALGMSAAAAGVEEKPPTFTESWRIARGVRTLRRIWMALPFLVGSSLGIGGLLAIYYEETFGLNEAARGALASFNEVFAIIGIVFGGAIGNRLLFRKPSRVVTYSALLAIVPATTYLIVAVTPWLPVAVAASAVSALIVPALGPAFIALMTLTIPPRVRGFALGAGSLFIIPGLAIAVIAAGMGDAFGTRVAIFAFVPVFLIGAAIIGSAAPSVDADIRAAMAAAAASIESKRSKEAGQTKLLVCRDVDVHYGQIQVLFNVDFEVAEGEIVALLGTNGAGKSTLLNAIAGVTTASNGAIFFDGEDITFLPAAEHVNRGVVLVPGGKGIFPSLTVDENLRLAAWRLDRPDDEVAAALAWVFEQFPILAERRSEAAGSLSGGQQQMLTLGQAFLARPRLLMIDELSLGLAPTVVEQLLGVVRAVRDNGTTVVLVEQSVNVALTVADRAVFMEKGEVRFTGPAEELLARPDVLRSVFLSGTGVGSRLRTKADTSLWEDEREVVLEVSSLSKSFGGISAVADVDLTLRDGEILGIIGPNGAGKTTLFDLISGFVLPDRGSVSLLGADVTELSPDARSRLGLQRSFQDARLFPALSVEENLLYALDRHLSVRNPAWGALRLPRSRAAEARLRKRAERIIMLLHLEPFRDKFVRELSTGSRRLVDLGCILATDPQVLLLDEPSSGVAQKEAEELGPLVQRIKTETACSVLIIEHDMNLISTLSDELLALDLGQVVTRGRPEDVLAHPQVVASYLGTSAEAIHRSGPAAAPTNGPSRGPNRRRTRTGNDTRSTNRNGNSKGPDQ